MARNIEIKARVHDAQGMQRRVERIAGPHFEMLLQEDIFFPVPHGRLKLRIENGKGQLIHYMREDLSGPKRSDYEIADVQEPERLKVVLAAALGMRGVVKKKRRLYRYGRTRFHLDSVERLGSFVEIEIVQPVRRTRDEPEASADSLIKDLEINEDDLMEGAYIDLLEKEGR